MHEEAYKMCIKLYEDKPHKLTAKNLLALGADWEALNDFLKAKDCYFKAYEMYKKLLGDNHKDTLQAKQALDRLNSQNYCTLF